MALSGIETLKAEIAEAGYRLLAARWVSAAGWAAYYLPLEAALATCDDPGLVAAFTAEIANWRAHGDAFGYRLCLVEPR